MGEVMTTRDQVLTAIEREREAWDALVAEVGEPRMLHPGAMGNWTFKDLAAHITSWEVYALDRLEAAAAGQPQPAHPWPEERVSDEEINTWMWESCQERSLAEVIADSRAPYARLATLVRTLPETALNDPNAFPPLDGKALGPDIVSGAYFEHFHVDHEDDVRRMLTASA